MAGAHPGSSNRPRVRVGAFGAIRLRRVRLFADGPHRSYQRARAAWYLACSVLAESHARAAPVAATRTHARARECGTPQSRGARVRPSEPAGFPGSRGAPLGCDNAAE